MRQHNGTLAARSADGTAQALEEYLAAAEAGTAPPREQFLARYPELADDLDACLAALHFIGRAAGGPRSVAAGVIEPQPPEQAPGQLGDFRLIREIGRGGMGVVYEAEQVSLGRRVALKVLPFAATMDPRQLQRFHNEARAAASLDHPHIVPVHAVGCERAVHFYAMQFIDGQTLAALIADQRQRGGQAPLPEAQPTTPHIPGQPAPAADTAERAAASTERSPCDRAYFRRVAELGIQAAEALDHAHALGIVHRDVKPANLLVDARGGLWVTDFGLAHMQSDARLTMTGDLVGTLRYMSPEQALAKRVVVDHRTDVYSLGATLYELLTLEPAFSGGDRQELLRQIAFEEPRPPRRVSKAIPVELETVVLKAMEKNPADRYATAKEVAEDLRRFLADEPVRARRPNLWQRTSKWARRHRALVRAAVAVVLTALLLAGAALGWEQRRQAAAERAVEAGLERAALLQQQERWEEARAVLAVAESELEGRGLATLRERVRLWKRDVEMQTRLDEARMRRASASKESGTDYTGANRLYAEAFAWYGLEITAEAPDEAANRVRASAISSRLIPALDDWAFVRDQLHRGDGAPLRAVGDRCDDDPWRRRLRGARGERAALEQLAQEEGALGQPSVNLELLAVALGDAGSWPVAERLLRQAQAGHRADFWINFQLAIAVLRQDPADTWEVIRFLQAAGALRPESFEVHFYLGLALGKKGKADEAIAEWREALRLRENSPEAHNNLGNLLADKGRLDDAIAEYREALRLRPDLAQAHHNLGMHLRDKGDVDGAIAECRQAIALDPKDVSAHANLSIALGAKGDQDGAIAELRRAIDLDPKEPAAHYNLGLALYHNNDLNGAIVEYRKAIELDTEEPEAHYNLGLALEHQGRVDEAIAEYREAIGLKPDSPEAHCNLGILLNEKGRLDEAIAEFREAIRLNKELPQAHVNLGAALHDKGRLDEAIAECQEALRLKKDNAEAHCNLGQVLRDKGQFTEALTHLRRGHELGTKEPRWPYPSALWVKECERLVEFDGKLPAILSGKERPVNAREWADYADVCQKKCLHVAAARLFQHAIAASPDLVASPVNGLRYDAACAAALAGCGAGEDAAKLADAERAALRQQALDWLRADLDAWRGLLDRAPDKARPALTKELTKKMQHWLHDTDFNDVRGPDALGKLPEAEREGWRTLWTDVAALAAARSQGTPETPKVAADQAAKND